MSQTIHLLSLPVESETAMPQVLDALHQAGLQTVLSFDLKVALSSIGDCSCPHHGTKQCNCQMVFIIVYEEGIPPATLVAHGRDGKTQLHLVDSPDQRPNSILEGRIRQALKEIKLVHIIQDMNRGIH